MNILRSFFATLADIAYTLFQGAGTACLVGSSGLEPPTSCLSGMRSNLLSYEPMYDRGDSCAFSPRRGGDDGIRTHDPLLAGQVLSQLSYTPIQGASLFSSGTLSDSR